MKLHRFLLVGLLVSVAAHAAGSAYFAPGADEVEVAASRGGEVSVIGSLEDLVAGTESSLETVEKLSEVSAPVDRVLEITALQPVEPLPPVQRNMTVPVVAGVTDTRTVTAEARPGQIEPEISQAIEPARQLEPAEPVEQFPEAAQPPTPETAQTGKQTKRLEEEIETVEPIEQTEVVLATPVAKPELPKREKPPRKQKKKLKSKRGADQNSRRGGETVTGAKGKSNAYGRRNATSSDGGEKARSNYNGKVLSRLRRAKRYPAIARRERLEGTVTVGFTVSRNGSVSGVRIVRSSGHVILDQAARDMVNRAAPMPKIPRETGKHRISFTVPVRFSR